MNSRLSFECCGPRCQMKGRKGGRVVRDGNRVCVRVRCIVLVENGKRIELGKENRIVDYVEAPWS